MDINIWFSKDKTTVKAKQRNIIIQTKLINTTVSILNYIMYLSNNNDNY